MFLLTAGAVSSFPVRAGAVLGSALTGFFRRFIPSDSLMILLFYLILINLLAFILMGVDKHKARRGAFRIPEATLFLFALAGGSIGSLLGMHVFHHKTRKLRFVVGMPAILLLQLILCLLLYTQAGAVIFQ